MADLRAQRRTAERFAAAADILHAFAVAQDESEYFVKRRRSQCIDRSVCFQHIQNAVEPVAFLTELLLVAREQ